MEKSPYIGLRNDFSSRKDMLYSALESEVARLDLPLVELTKGIAASAADSLYSVDYLPRKNLLDAYKEGRLRHEIDIAKGNLTQVTRNLYKVDDADRINVLRRNVNDWVDNFDLRAYVDHRRPWKDMRLEDSLSQGIPYPEAKIVDALSSGLSAYRGIIHPDVYGSVKQKILEYAPAIAETVAPLLPSKQSTIDYLIKRTEGMTWDESVALVESIAVDEAMKNAQGDKQKAAKYLGNSVKTLERKLANLKRPVDGSVDDKTPSDVTRLRDLLKEKVKDTDKKTPKRTQAEYFQAVAAEYDLAA